MLSTRSSAARLVSRESTEPRRVAFRSGVDGSVQYYALRPACPPDGNLEHLGLILTLHGAGVDATAAAGASRRRTVISEAR